MTTLTPPTTTASAEPGASAELEAAIGAFAERVFLAAVGAFELATIELGMRLELYPALAGGAQTAVELAVVAGIDQRYAREWLEQQATAGFVRIEADGPDDDPDQRRFSLPVAHQIALLDPDSLAAVAPLATFAAAGPGILPELVEAYRTGAGISFAGYGEWIRRAQAAANRPLYTNLLVEDWLAALPDVTARLGRPGGRVADLGCGSGWSSIAIARGFPLATIDGFDSDDASITDARANAAAAGVADRVRFTTADAAGLSGPPYDLVCCCEALHDMAHPVEALRTMRALAGGAGAVFVVDDRAADALTANDPDPAQRLFYASSVLHCLPVGRSEEGSAATGTLLRTGLLERYATEAGFSSVEVLPIDHAVLRFYRLR
jgi:SAM-dependent methyltransferase